MYLYSRNIKKIVVCLLMYIDNGSIENAGPDRPRISGLNANMIVSAVIIRNKNKKYRFCTAINVIVM